MAAYDFFIQQVCPEALKNGGIHAIHRVRLSLETEKERELLETVLFDRKFEEQGLGVESFDLNHADPKQFARDRDRVLREMEDGAS